MRGFAKLLLVLLPFFAEAQTVISFSYDSSGNRIKREIVLESRSIGDEHIKEFTETISAKQIKIYPNPTRGLLKVEIAGCAFSMVSIIASDIVQQSFLFSLFPYFLESVVAFSGST